LGIYTCHRAVWHTVAAATSPYPSRVPPSSRRLGSQCPPQNATHRDSRPLQSLVFALASPPSRAPNPLPSRDRRSARALDPDGLAPPHPPQGHHPRRQRVSESDLLPFPVPLRGCLMADADLFCISFLRSRVGKTSLMNQYPAIRIKS
jgi:hypothetical protein